MANGMISILRIDWSFAHTFCQQELKTIALGYMNLKIDKRNITSSLILEHIFSIKNDLRQRRSQNGFSSGPCIKIINISSK